MKSNSSSRTAEYNALFRAIETRFPRSQQLFRDDLARRFLGPQLAVVERACGCRLARRGVVAFIDRRWPGVRTSVAARTVLIDQFVEELAADVDQVVFLGAGFDTRPIRLTSLRDLCVFEVDHEATQARKRRALAGRQSSSVHYVPSDFNLREMDQDIAAAGYSAAKPTLVVWEGVSNYLTADAVSSMLRWCGRLASGSHVIFTYVDEQVLTNPERYHGSRRLRASLDRAGEPLAFGLAPHLAGCYLADRGLELVCDLGAADYRAKAYGRTTAARMIGHEFYRVALARPTPIAASGVVQAIDGASGEGGEQGG